MIGIVLTASYHIYTLQRTIFGPYNEYLGNIMENRNEILASLILLIPIIVLGIYPSLILHFFNISQIGMGVFK
jgi:NADH:ubiquinone oxidoreductase subunit 4 (chain M)